MKKHLPIIFLLSFAACSRATNNTSSATLPSYTLQDVKAEPIVTMAPLTDEQKLTIKTNSTNTNVLPPTSLIVFDQASADQTKEARDKALATVSKESRAEFDRVQSNCKIVQPTTSTIGDTSGAVGAIQIDNSQSSVAGAGCSIDDQEAVKRTIKTLKSDKAQVTKEVTEESTQVLKVVDNDLAKRSNLVSRSQTSKTVTTSTIYSLTGATKVYTEMNVTGGSNHGNSNLDQVEIIQRSSTLQNSKSEAPQRRDYLRINATVSDIKVVIQAFNDGKTISFYLNGEKLTSDEIKTQTGMVVGL